MIQVEWINAFISALIHLGYSKGYLKGVEMVFNVEKVLEIHNVFTYILFEFIMLKRSAYKLNMFRTLAFSIYSLTSAAN